MAQILEKELSLEKEGVRRMYPSKKIEKKKGDKEIREREKKKS